MVQQNQVSIVLATVLDSSLFARFLFQTVHSTILDGDYLRTILHFTSSRQAACQILALEVNLMIEPKLFPMGQYHTGRQ